MIKRADEEGYWNEVQRVAAEAEAYAAERGEVNEGDTKGIARDHIRSLIGSSPFMSPNRTNEVLEISQQDVLDAYAFGMAQAFTRNPEPPANVVLMAKAFVAMEQDIWDKIYEMRNITPYVLPSEKAKEEQKSKPSQPTEMSIDDIPTISMDDLLDQLSQTTDESEKAAIMEKMRRLQADFHHSNFQKKAVDQSEFKYDSYTFLGEDDGQLYYHDDSQVGQYTEIRHGHYFSAEELEERAIEYQKSSLEGMGSEGIGKMVIDGWTRGYYTEIKESLVQELVDGERVNVYDKTVYHSPDFDETHDTREEVIEEIRSYADGESEEAIGKYIDEIEKKEVFVHEFWEHTTDTQEEMDDYIRDMMDSDIETFLEGRDWENDIDEIAEYIVETDGAEQIMGDGVYVGSSDQYFIEQVETTSLDDLLAQDWVSDEIKHEARAARTGQYTLDLEDPDEEIETESNLDTYNTSMPAKPYTNDMDLDVQADEEGLVPYERGMQVTPHRENLPDTLLNQTYKFDKETMDAIQAEEQQMMQMQYAQDPEKFAEYQQASQREHQALDAAMQHGWQWINIRGNRVERMVSLSMDGETWVDFYRGTMGGVHGGQFELIKDLTKAPDDVTPETLQLPAPTLELGYDGPDIEAEGSCAIPQNRIYFKKGENDYGKNQGLERDDEEREPEVQQDAPSDVESPSTPQSQQPTQEVVELPEPVFPSADDLLYSNQDSLRHGGGGGAGGSFIGTDDEGMGRLEAVAARAQNAFYYEGASLTTQAALLCHGIVSGHVFADGNHRTASSVTMAFLALNGLEIAPGLEELGSAYNYEWQMQIFDLGNSTTTPEMFASYLDAVTSPMSEETKIELDVERRLAQMKEEETEIPPEEIADADSSDPDDDVTFDDAPEEAPAPENPDVKASARVTASAWKKPPNYAGKEWPRFYVAAYQNRDSSEPEKLAFQIALDRLGGEDGKDVVITREGHYSLGWVEWIGVHKGAQDKVDTLDKVLAEQE